MDLRAFAPVVRNDATSRRVEPAFHTLWTAVLLEPAKRFEEDGAGEVFCNDGLVDLPVDIPIEVSNMCAIDGLQLSISAVFFRE